ncbi:MAG: hypothetical protein IPJ58_02425 [Ardenticatenia bacterium]|nr:hypothetical protein [Ardenticatenia bacterium]
MARRVLRYEPTRDRWTDYFSDQTVNGQVSAMAADAGGSVWFGVTDAEDGAATLVRRDPSGRWQAVNMQAVARGIEDARVQSLALTPDGSVVQTTFNDYLLLYGAAGVGKWMPQDRLPPTSGPLPLCADRDGRLWTLPFSGLASHREPSGWRIEQTADGLPYPAFSSIACAADGSLWLGNPRSTSTNNVKVWQRAVSSGAFLTGAGRICARNSDWASRASAPWHRPRRLLGAGHDPLPGCPAIPPGRRSVPDS